MKLSKQHPPRHLCLSLGFGATAKTLTLARVFDSAVRAVQVCLQEHFQVGTHTVEHGLVIITSFFCIDLGGLVRYLSVGWTELWEPLLLASTGRIRIPIRQRNALLTQ
jgi:hypothetical protein